MFMKPTPRRYLWMVLCAFLVACGKQVAALPPEIPVPTTILPTSTPATIFIPAIVTPSPLPTEPIIPILTPDAIQVEKWKEYEGELAKLVLSDSGAEFPRYKDALCEWDILGRAGDEVYVWAQC